LRGLIFGPCRGLGSSAVASWLRPLRRHSRLVLCGLTFIVGPALARQPPAPSLEALSHDPGWLKLGHYARASGHDAPWHSAIHSDDFFLDPQGSTDPQRELQATLLALAAPQGEDPDQHAQCRFPARWLWLRARLPHAPELQTAISCPALQAWTHANRVESLSIVFASGYLGNPASYYGHTLLKFNYKGEVGQTRLMDVSVNYGAIVDQQDGPITYIAKGLLGGYDGGFSHVQFYFHNHNYGDVELRDLWEYRLNLPPDAVNLVVAHAWEVLGKRYTYYFFRENCGYRMAELLQVADGVEVIPDRWPWLIPQAIVQQVGAARVNGQPLLAEVTYHPSRQTRFYDKYRRLDTTETTMLRALVTQQQRLDGGALAGLPPDARQRVVDALIDYYQFVGAPLERAPADIKAGYTQALAARYQLPPGPTAPNPPPPVSPHQSRAPGWLQLGLTHHSQTGQAITLHVRPAYYDELDADSGQVRNAALTMADLQLTVRRGHTLLQRFDLVRVDSANAALTGLPGDNGAAWRLHLGVEQQRLNCERCLVGRAQADIGRGTSWSNGWYGAVYLGGTLQNNRAGHGSGQARASAQLIYRPRDGYGLRLAHEWRVPLARQAERYSVTTVEGRWAMTRDLDLRLSHARDGAHQTGIGLGRYW